MPGPQRFLVVGGGLGGAKTCQQLRRQGFVGDITLIAAERHAPYDRPPLSKQVLRGDEEPRPLAVDLADLGVDVLSGTRASGLDLARRVVTAERSEAADHHGDTFEVAFDRMAIATGASPVRLPGPGPQVTVRTIDDAVHLRDRLVAGARVAVVGASWIGAEIASAALHHGCEVTCLEAGPVPLAAALGGEPGKRFLDWWDAVDLRLDTPVERVEPEGVRLGSGELVAADLVVTGVGVRPDLDWLAGSGLRIDRGVLVDEHLQAARGVVALGDAVARWSPRYASYLRVEHWDDAATAPAVAAATLLADGEGVDHLPTHDPVPYFWSDQFGHKLQYVGRHDTGTAPVFRVPDDGRGWSAAWLDGGGRLTAVLAVDRPREALAARRLLDRGHAPAPGRLGDPAIPLAET